MRLPTRVDIGFAVVRVRSVTKAEMHREAECAHDEEPPDGLWDPEEEAILVGRWLTQKRKREVYTHELIHAINDVGYWSQHET